ncbi:MAG: riboflavin synthase [Planctomycetota bacterium]
MFTGIVECMGRVVSVGQVAGGRRLTIEAGPVADDTATGASIAVDGVCLTVCGMDGSCLDFDVITETLSRTTLGRRRVNERVNLERSLRAGDRIDGHFVQGHVDGTAQVTRRQVSEREWVLWFKPTAQLVRYMLPKGSVAINGISLTIAAVQSGEFSVALIPTTVSRTTMGDLKVGDVVNVESDILARTIVHALEGMAPGAGLTEAKLAEHGYL